MLANLIQKRNSEADPKLGGNNGHAPLLPAILPGKTEEYQIAMPFQIHSSKQDIILQNKSSIQSVIFFYK